MWNVSTGRKMLHPLKRCFVSPEILTQISTVPSSAAVHWKASLGALMPILKYESSLGERFVTIWRVQWKNKQVTFQKSLNINASNEILSSQISKAVTPKAKWLTPFTNKILTNDIWTKENILKCYFFYSLTNTMWFTWYSIKFLYQEHRKQHIQLNTHDVIVCS